MKKVYHSTKRSVTTVADFIAFSLIIASHSLSLVCYGFPFSNINVRSRYVNWSLKNSFVGEKFNQNLVNALKRIARS